MRRLPMLIALSLAAAASAGAPARGDTSSAMTGSAAAEYRLDEGMAEIRIRQPESATDSETPPPAESGDDAATLSVKLSNPVADLISIPFQFNYDDGLGVSKTDRVILNIQPVIPITLNKDWNLITRTIMPVVYLGSLSPGLESEFGLGDILQSFFFSPKKPYYGWIIGAGPVISYPTATDNALGSEQWSAGPTFVVLQQKSGWTYGMLANQLWSFAGDKDREDVNSTYLQPFLSYTFSTATSITLNSESTYDWTADEWTTPINLVAGQIVKLGGVPVQFFLGGRYYVAAPDEGPEWGVRFGFTILLPK